MKTLKQLLWFIIPTFVINLMIYIIAFVQLTNEFVGVQQYLRLFLDDKVFKRALVNTFALPLIFALCLGVVLFLAKWMLLKGKYNSVFYSVTLIISSLIFYFTTILRLIMGLTDTANSPRYLMQPDIYMILISLQVGVLICFLFWCGDKIASKIKQV